MRRETPPHTQRHSPSPADTSTSLKPLWPLPAVHSTTALIGCLWPLSVCTGAAESTSIHTHSRLSAPPVTTMPPSADTAHARTSPRCPSLRTAVHAPAASHTRAVLSCEHVTTTLPLGVAAASRTAPEWPRSSCATRIDGRDHTLTADSDSPTVTRRPAGPSKVPRTSVLRMADECS